MFDDERQEAYAYEIAENIWNKVELLGIGHKDAEALANVLPELLRQMALRLGHGVATPEEREAQAFLHRNRRWVR